MRLKNVIVTLLFIFGTPLLLHAQWAVRDRRPKPQHHRLKGPVRRATQVQSPLSNRRADWLDGYSGQNYTEEYNRAGLLLTRIQRDDFNQPHQAVHYTYDAAGQVETVRDEPFQSGRMASTSGAMTYRFNPATNVLTVEDRRIIMGQPVNRRSEVRVDSAKGIYHKREFTNDTVLVQEVVRQWDRRGNPTMHVTRTNRQFEFGFRPARFSAKDLQKFMGEVTPGDTAMTPEIRQALATLNRREDSPRLAREKQGTVWAADTVRYRNEYDTQGRLVKQEEIHGGRLVVRKGIVYGKTTRTVTSQSFDRQGQLSSEHVDEEDLTTKAVLKSVSRNRTGDKWEENTYSRPVSEQSVYQYRYDRYGNWIEKKQVKPNGVQPGPALVRSIDYY